MNTRSLPSIQWRRIISKCHSVLPLQSFSQNTTFSSLACCCYRPLEISGWILHAPKMAIETFFFFASLTLTANCYVIVVHHDSMTVKLLSPYKRITTSRHQDPQQRTTKEYSWGNLSQLTRCWHLVSHRLSPPTFVMHFYFTDRSRSRCRHKRLELGPKLIFCLMWFCIFISGERRVLRHKVQ